MRGLFGDERLLHGIGARSRVPRPLERHDVATGAALDRNHAEARGDAVDQHGAGAALAEAAAIFRSIEFEIVAQHVKQDSIRRRVDVAIPAVHGQAHRNGVCWRFANLRGDYCLYTNVQVAHVAVQRRARFVNMVGRQVALICGRRLFLYSPCRLTALRLPRRIIRIRMNRRRCRRKSSERAGVLMAMEVTARSGDKIR